MMAVLHTHNHVLKEKTRLLKRNSPQKNGNQKNTMKKKKKKSIFAVF